MIDLNPTNRLLKTLQIFLNYALIKINYMLCPKCQLENPSENKFCNHCGADLNLSKTVPVQSSPDYSEKNKKSPLIIGAVVLFLILGILSVYFVLNKSKESISSSVSDQQSQSVTDKAQPSSPETPPPASGSPSQGQPTGGTSLIGSSQKISGVAMAMRNLAGMLVQINQIDVCAFPLLKVYATVTDKEGKSFTNILQTDFTLNIDGQEIQEFTMSNMGSKRVPLSIALVIDRSGSMEGEPMIKAKEAAVDFVNRLNSQDKISLIQFDTEIELLQSATNDKAAIIEKINSITPRSDTAIYDVVHFSAQNLTACGRKAIILLTDGRDTASKQYSLQESINQANQVNVPVFVVGLKSYQFTPEILKQIAEQTGAQYFEAPTPTELSTMYQKISGQLDGQHQFEFQATHAKDTQEHRLRLKSNILGSDTNSEKSYLIP